MSFLSKYFNESQFEAFVITAKLSRKARGDEEPDFGVYTPKE